MKNRARIMEALSTTEYKTPEQVANETGLDKQTVSVELSHLYLKEPVRFARPKLHRARAEPGAGAKFKYMKGKRAIKKNGADQRLGDVKKVVENSFTDPFDTLLDAMVAAKDECNRLRAENARLQSIIETITKAL